MLINIPIQDLIEQNVTNGLGYNKTNVRLGEIFQQIFPEKGSEKSKYFLKAHLANLEYKAISFNCEVIGKILEITSKENYWLKNKKENMAVEFNRKQLEGYEKFLKREKEYFSSSSDYYNFMANPSIKTSEIIFSLIVKHITKKEQIEKHDSVNILNIFKLLPVQTLFSKYIKNPTNP